MENTGLRHHHVGLRLEVVSQPGPDQVLLLPLLEYHQDGLHAVHAGAVLPPAVIAGIDTDRGGGILRDQGV